MIDILYIFYRMNIDYKSVILSNKNVYDILNFNFSQQLEIIKNNHIDNKFYILFVKDFSKYNTDIELNLRKMFQIFHNYILHDHHIIVFYNNMYYIHFINKFDTITMKDIEIEHFTPS
jgi:hypothetical protein